MNSVQCKFASQQQVPGRIFSTGFTAAVLGDDVICWNAMSPPQLPRHAPVLDVAKPVLPECSASQLKLVGTSITSYHVASNVSGTSCSWPDVTASKARCRCTSLIGISHQYEASDLGHGLAVDIPLWAQHWLNDITATAAQRHSLCDDARIESNLNRLNTLAHTIACGSLPRNSPRS